MEDLSARKNDLPGSVRDPRVRFAVLSALIFSVLAHAYRWTMTGFIHDSLVIFQEEHDWQTALGRFLIPLYVLIRGKMTAPFLVAAFATAFFALSIVLIVRILDIRSRVGIAALSGLMATYSVLTDTYANYLPWADVYMLALFLSVLAVYLYVRYPLGWIPAAVLTALSMGLYPSYIQCAAVLCLVWLVKACVEGEKTPFVFRRGCIALAFLALSGILYYATWRLFLLTYGIEPALTANGITAAAGLLEEGPLRIPYLIYRACRIVVHEFLYPFAFNPILTGICGGLLCLLTAVSLFRAAGDWKNRLRILVLVLLIPLASNCVYVLSNGYHNITMRYPIVTCWALVVMMLDLRVYRDAPPVSPAFGKALRAGAAVLFAVIVLNCTIYSNEVYLKEALESEATLSAMTRVLVRMEDTEGYVPGETAVVLEGDLNRSAVPQYRPGYPKENTSYAMSHHYATRYHSAYRNYFTNVLGYPVNLADQDVSARYVSDPRVIAMPAFPDPGCCEMIDGMLFVKLSEDMETERDYANDYPK